MIRRENHYLCYDENGNKVFDANAAIAGFFGVSPQHSLLRDFIDERRYVIEPVVKAMDSVWNIGHGNNIDAQTFDSLYSTCIKVFGDNIEAAAVYAVMKNYNGFWEPINSRAERVVIEEVLDRYNQAFDGTEKNWRKFIGVLLTVERAYPEAFTRINKMDHLNTVSRLWDEYGFDCMPDVTKLLRMGQDFDMIELVLANGIDLETFRVAV